MRFRIAVLFVCLFAGALQPLRAQEETLVFLVRHAEKVGDGSSNPDLTEAGWERARLLAQTLLDAGITHIHSTGFTRTLDTGKPLAEALGLEVEVYGSGRLEAFAGVLKGMPGRHLVVGHSNTTPDLVEALGGDPGDPINDLEYDRLYLVALEEGQVRTVLLRFGAPYVPGGDAPARKPLAEGGPPVG